jgi:hypothetical protein
LIFKIGDDEDGEGPIDTPSRTSRQGSVSNIVVQVLHLNEDGSLTDDEARFAKSIRMTADHYLNMRAQFSEAYQKNGFYKKAKARAHVRGCDTMRIGKLWEFFIKIGVIGTE